MDWQAVTDAGLYDPAAPGAADRKALVEYLDAQGCTLDEMVAAHARGRLFGLAGDRIIRPGRDEYTLREAAAEVGADPALIQRLWRAYGLPIVDADSKVASRDDVDTLPLFVALAGLLGEDAALGLARVAGACVARFADAISGALRTTMQDLDYGLSGSEATTARVFAEVAPLAPATGRMLDVLLRHHIEASRRHFEQTESHDVARQGQVWSAVGFADLSGFTALAEAASSADLSRLVEQFEDTAFEVVHDAGGRVVKFIGDAVMYVTPQPAAAVDAALKLVATMDRPVRAGVTYGLLLAQDGDYFGPPVNLAARLVEAAEPGIVVASADLTGRLDGTYVTTPLPPRPMRGIAEPVAAYAVEVSSAPPPSSRSQRGSSG